MYQPVPTPSMHSYIHYNGTKLLSDKEKLKNIAFLPYKELCPTKWNLLDKDLQILDKKIINDDENIQTTDALDATWKIIEKTPGDSRVNLTVEWPSSAELSGFDPTTCFFSHYRNGNWYPGNATDVSASDPRTITLENITSFSPFAIGSGNSPFSPAICPTNESVFVTVESNPVIIAIDPPGIAFVNLS